MTDRVTSFLWLVIALSAVLSQPLHGQTSGVRWVRQDSLFNDLYYDVDAADSLHFVGIARFMGYRNTIRRSTDGGVTWHQTYVDSARLVRLCRVSYPRPDLCLVSCDSGRVLRSIDSGKTWQMMQAGPRDNPGTTITMAPDGFGVLIIPPTWLAVSSDEGRSWTERSLPDTLIKLGMVFGDIQRLSRTSIIGIMASASNGKRTIRSDDDGLSWRLYVGPMRCAGFHFVDSLRGWSAGSQWTGDGDLERDVIAHTTDGGRTWAEQLNVLIDPEFGLNAVEFADSLHGIAVGQVGKILRTSDGGEHWIQDQSGLDLREIPQIVGVAYPVKSLAIAVTNNGDVLRYRDTLPPLPAAVPLRAASGTDMQLVPNLVAAGSSIYLTLHLAKDDEVELRMIDLLGHEVMARQRMPLETGEQKLVLSGVSALRSGMYFVRASVGGSVHLQALRIE